MGEKFKNHSDNPDDELLEINFNAFYHAFAEEYFNCFSCAETKEALSVICHKDMTDWKNSHITWTDWHFWLLWALREYPRIAGYDDLLAHVFRHGIIPLYRDEISQKRIASRTSNSRLKRI